MASALHSHTPVMRQRFMAPQRKRLSLLQVAIVLIAGGAHAASIAWPFAFISGLSAGLGLIPGQPVWWLQWLALGLLVWQLDGSPSWRRTACLGWLFATAMQCGTWWWLFISLHTFGGLATPLAVLAVIGLAGFMALYHAAACGIYLALRPDSLAGRAWLFASLWLFAELARVSFFTGFPWGESGYAQLGGPFADLAKLVGVHGLSFGSALAAAALSGLLGRARWGHAAGLGALLLLAGLGSAALRADKDGATAFTAALPAATGQPLSVTLLQGNIAQNEKFEFVSGIPDALDWYDAQLRSAKTALVVTPETAIPLRPTQLPPNYLTGLVSHFTQPAKGTPPRAALIGLPLGNGWQGYSNSALGLKPATLDGASFQAGLYRYDKHHLVPFGEYLHPLFKWYLRLVNIPLIDLSAGAIGQDSFVWQGQRLGPNICYEDLFGEELGARFADPTQSPTVLVNLSNIAWFGNTIAIDQHLNISRMRALEFERPLLRATNTGATVIIDHRGEVTHSLARHTRGTLTGEVWGRSGTTPYAWWVSRWGLWPLWGLIALVLAAALVQRGQRERLARLEKRSHVR